MEKEIKIYNSFFLISEESPVGCLLNSSWHTGSELREPLFPPPNLNTRLCLWQSLYTWRVPNPHITCFIFTTEANPWGQNDLQISSYRTTLISLKPFLIYWEKDNWDTNQWRLCNVFFISKLKKKSHISCYILISISTNFPKRFIWWWLWSGFHKVRRFDRKILRTILKS